jgi:hypothetical protein
MKRFLLPLLTLGLVLPIAAPAYASITFDISRATSGSGSWVQVSNNQAQTSYSTYNTTQGGAFWAQKTSSNGNLVLPLTEHTIFCLEIFETFGWGTVTRELTLLENAPIDNGDRSYESPMAPLGATMIRQLWAQYFDGLNIAHSANYDTTVGAFQIALWELAYDAGKNGISLANGYFKANTASSEGQAAIAMLLWLNDNPNAPQADLIALTSNGSQDFVGQVPEPATLIIWLLLGSTVGGCGVWRRLRAA